MDALHILSGPCKVGKHAVNSQPIHTETFVKILMRFYTYAGTNNEIP